MTWIADNKDFLIGSSSIIAVLGFLWGLRTYIANVRLQRAKWLLDFYRIFFLDQSYKEIRRKIDFEFNHSLAPVLRKILRNSSQKFSKEEQLLLMALDEYLNFFEFILHLKESKLRQLSEEDFQSLFRYFIVRVGEFELLREYIKTYDYEFLERYLKGAKR